jgi:hypothetical protein
VLFRSRFFTAAKPSAAAGEVRFVWSPATVLEGILRIADREARKVQGRERLHAAGSVRKLTWEQAKELPPIVLYIMASDADQELDVQRATEFGRDVKVLEKNPEGFTDEQRKLLLGVRIVRFAGARVLKEAVDMYIRGSRRP